MSADTLRTAAAKMRERAEAATPGPWIADGYDVLHKESAAQVADCFDEEQPNAEHIAGMDPVVALAVADWLDLAAKRVDLTEGLGDGIWMQVDKAAVAVASAYLGTP